MVAREIHVLWTPVAEETIPRPSRSSTALYAKNIAAKQFKEWQADDNTKPFLSRNDVTELGDAQKRTQFCVLIRRLKKLNKIKLQIKKKLRHAK